MTSSHYLFARIAMAFGYVRKAQRMGEAASEMHLLREAEAQLGAAIWEKVENIEALSVEYWNLRKLVKQNDEVRLRLTECQNKLNKWWPTPAKSAGLMSATKPNWRSSPPKRAISR